MNRVGRRVLVLLLAVAALTVLAAIFLAYQQPELLLDWVNVRYCG